MANWLNGSLPYLPLLLFAVMLSAWFGGVGPGVLSTALSVFVFATLHFLPNSTFESPNVPRVAFMGGLALVIALLTAAQRRATSDLRESRDTLQRNNARLQNETLERVRAMDSLRETNDKLDMIVNNSPLPIVGADAAGRITDWNRAAEELFGWTAPEDGGGSFRSSRDALDARHRPSFYHIT
jgi:PAS domain-containing protein